VVLAVACLLRYPLADIPLDRDEGEYAYIGQRWLLGEVPFQGSFDQKPPGAFLFYALFQLLLGTSPAALHWGAQLCTLGTLAIIFFLGRQLFGAPAGLVAALLAACLTADCALHGNAANTEVFLILPLAGSLLTALWAAERNSLAWAFATGLLAAAAVFCKQVAALPFAFVLAVLLATCRRRWQAAAAMLAGAAALSVVVVGYFCAAGAGAEFYDCVLGDNLQHGREIPLAAYTVYFWRFFRPILARAWPIILLALLGLTLGRDPRVGGAGQRRGVLLVACWLACCLVGIVPGGYFSPHYFLVPVPALALLAGWGAVAVARLLPPPWPPAPVAGLLGAAALVYGVAQSPWYYWGQTAEQKCAGIYGPCVFAESPAVGRYLAEHTGPEDTVFVFGSEPQMYYYAGRKSASRYIFMYPLVKTFSGTRARQREVLDALRAHPPAAVVVVDLVTSLGTFQGPPPALYEELVTFIRQSYRRVAGVPASEDGPGPLLTGEALAGVPPQSQLVTVWFRSPLAAPAGTGPAARKPPAHPAGR
jgi:hypothetical protein